MSYTVKKLAELSGVSVRTLHWYDEIGLLKPANYGESGYRYYEREQLFLLQQILFFRELGFKLESIKELISKQSFDKISALQAHERQLEEKISRTKILIKTIQATIRDLKGEQKMIDKDMYQGFSEWLKEQDTSTHFIGEYADLEEEGTENEKFVMKNVKLPDTRANWTKEDWDRIMGENDLILKSLTKCLESGCVPSDKKVQDLIKKHYVISENFYHMTLDIYSALAELYRSKPEYRKQLDGYHKDLTEFIASAMKHYSGKGS